MRETAAAFATTLELFDLSMIFSEKPVPTFPDNALPAV